jgi:hypothetical protein
MGQRGGDTRAAAAANGKRVGRPRGSRNKPRLYVVCRAGTAVDDLIRLNVRDLGLERVGDTVALGKGRNYRSAAIDFYEARALHRYLESRLKGGDLLAASKRGGDTRAAAAANGKKVGRPPGSRKLLAMAAALSTVVPKSPEKSSTQVIASAAQETTVSGVP